MKKVCKRCGASLVLMFDCQLGADIDEESGDYDLTKAQPFTSKRGFFVQCEAGHYPAGYYYDAGVIKEISERTLNGRSLLGKDILSERRKDEKTNRRAAKNNP